MNIGRGWSTPTRRRFLRWLGLAGLVAGTAPATLATRARGADKPKAKPAAAPPPPDTAAAGPAPIGAGTPARPAPLVPSDDARALLSIIERRYGKQLSKEQLETIAREIEGDLRAGVRLRDVKLANGDEPDFTFRA